MALTLQEKAVPSLSTVNSGSGTSAEPELHKQNNTTQIHFLETGEPGRKHLERFISKVFKNYYNADLDHFYPNLLSIETNEPGAFKSDDSIKAVAGIRSATEEPLFSEFYLEHPLLKELTAIYDKTISREIVVEVGNLAPANVAQMRWLITVMTGFLYSAGFRYIVFTAIPGVSNAFKRMKLPLNPIIEAKQSRLPDAIKNKWGPEYYQLKPMVLSGDITEIFKRVKVNIYDKNTQYIDLFEQACHLGAEFLNKRTRLHGDAA